MPKREIEGDWLLGWPDRKRPAIIPGKDGEGRVINGRSPVTELGGLMTPTEAYFIVSHLETPDPVYPGDWKLAIKGEVERPFELDFDGLMKLPGRTVRAVTECAGNDAGFFDYLRKGARKPSRINRQDMQKRAERRIKGELPSGEELSSESTTTCAVSAGEFTGVSLVEVLRRAGVRPGAVCIRARGFDRGRPDLAVIYHSAGTLDLEIPDPGVIHFEKALPLEKALDPDTILAWAQNGEYLWHVHGAPVRLIVPGWSGNWWVKWVEELEVMRTMPKPFYQTEYFVYGESARDPNRPPLTAMGVRNIITEPLDEDSPLPRGSHMIRGRAWSGMGAIDRVEVSLDGGTTWSDAHLEEPRERWLWRRWSYLWEVDRPGEYRIMARATDAAGRVQPQTPWNYQRKHFDWIVPTEVTIV